MKKKKVVQGFEEAHWVINNSRAQLEETKRIEETLEYQKQCLESNIATQKEESQKRENILTGCWGS
jgi:ribosomal protein S6